VASAACCSIHRSPAITLSYNVWLVVQGVHVVEGITKFGSKTMTVRTSIRVKPGRCDVVASAFRLLIKEMFDRQTQGARRTLIPHARAVR
jgi:hypothetical protein